MKSSPALETPDIDSSSADYATRFSGRVGAWFLEVQERATLSLLRDHPAATVLDVGGGHGQTLAPLVRAGYRVTVLGSDASCRERIRDLVDSGAAAFATGNLLALPYAAGAFDVGISYRILPHLADWKGLIAELTRVSAKAVLVDFPVMRSVNSLSRPFFALKKNVETNTRPFTVFREEDVVAEFRRHGFAPAGKVPQFLLPMALHRALGNRPLSAASEGLFRASGLSSVFGSPLISRFVRTGASGAAA